MTADNCLFHGSRDCPAARELEHLDWQINQRLHAEKIIRETRDALTSILSDIRKERGGMRMGNIKIVSDGTPLGIKLFDEEGNDITGLAGKNLHRNRYQALSSRASFGGLHIQIDAVRNNCKKNRRITKNLRFQVLFLLERQGYKREMTGPKI